MKLFNSLTKKTEKLKPLEDKVVRIYSCGPTVYDNVHIGNLRTYIFEDILRRILKQSGYTVKHVMNITDVDDKTITRSRQKYPNDNPKVALEKLTRHFENVFYKDARAVGIDFHSSKIVRATEHIAEMQEFIRQISAKYVAKDGVYFDIAKYPYYGIFINLDQSHTHHRIQNDEYDKDYLADFALWKAKKDNEPAWNFEIDNKNIEGRPGWHIECSAMSTKYLGQPFDIHTGGVDLKFPHHENEIAQSKAATGKDLAKVFLHAEHLLVNGHKMSKSLNNFYTLYDIVKKGYDPLAFRLLVLQSHYRSQLNFTWESLEAAQSRLKDLQAFSCLRFQTSENGIDFSEYIMMQVINNAKGALEDDVKTPIALASLSNIVQLVKQKGDTFNPRAIKNVVKVIDYYDSVLGLGLSDVKDISKQQKKLINDREAARINKNWKVSDAIRKQLEEQKIGLNDTKSGPIWYRL